MDEYICNRFEKLNKRCPNNIVNEFTVEISEYKKIKLCCGCNQKIKMLTEKEFKEFLFSVIAPINMQFKVFIFNHYKGKIDGLDPIKKFKVTTILEESDGYLAMKLEKKF